MAVLVSDIVADVIVQLSMVTGVSTQVYASPHIQQHVQDATILLMDEEWWPNLMAYFQVSLDGTTGSLVSDLTISGFSNHSISRYQDIDFVMISGTDQRLRRMPTNLNPFLLTGATAQFMVPSALLSKRPFIVYPITATDQLVVRAKLYPTIPMSTTDTVYLDRLLLTYMAAYMYSEDDGTNPGQIAKFKMLFEKRLKQVKASWEHQPMPLSGTGRGGLYSWQEGPWA